MFFVVSLVQFCLKLHLVFTGLHEDLQRDRVGNEKQTPGDERGAAGTTESSRVEIEMSGKSLNYLQKNPLLSVLSKERNLRADFQRKLDDSRATVYVSNEAKIRIARVVQVFSSPTLCYISDMFKIESLDHQSLILEDQLLSN